MAQSATTVLTPSPTPPTNFSSVGSPPPNPATFDPLIYHNNQASTAGNFPQAMSPHYPRPQLAPYFDDGTAGPLTTFATNTAALLVGGTTAAHEGAGDNNSVVTAPGSRPECPTQSFSCGPVATQATREAGPNATHASSLSPATNPALASISPTTLAAATTGTQLITCTGTNFKPGCRVWHDNVEQDTTYVSATSLTALVKKKPHAGVAPVVVKLGGMPMGVVAPFTWT